MTRRSAFLPSLIVGCAAQASLFLAVAGGAWLPDLLVAGGHLEPCAHGTLGRLVAAQGGLTAECAWVPSRALARGQRVDADDLVSRWVPMEFRVPGFREDGGRGLQLARDVVAGEWVYDEMVEP